MSLFKKIVRIGSPWLVVPRSVEFSRELRLYAARRILKFSFSSDHVSQHGLQPLRPQDDESEHEHEQDFCSESHASPLGYGLVIGNYGCVVGWFLFLGLYG
jgi:hypothetical protein